MGLEVAETGLVIVQEMHIIDTNPTKYTKRMYFFLQINTPQYKYRGVNKFLSA
jgi:spore maturation protein SpmA